MNKIFLIDDFNNKILEKFYTLEMSHCFLIKKKKRKEKRKRKIREMPHEHVHILNKI